MVALSRLVYRKGIDLMALVIPYICSMYPNVDFVIGEISGCVISKSCVYVYVCSGYMRVMEHANLILACRRACRSTHTAQSPIQMHITLYHAQHTYAYAYAHTQHTQAVAVQNLLS